MNKKTKKIVKDYFLKDSTNKEVTLSRLFNNKEELILIHNMGTHCRYCTMWADGFNGVLPHLENRAAFVVVSPDDPATQKKFAQRRKWKFTMLSSKGTSFSKDMGFETKEGKPIPGVSVFTKNKEGKILRVAKETFGPGDHYCIVWHFFDLLPKGANEWEPQYFY